MMRHGYIGHCLLLVKLEFDASQLLCTIFSLIHNVPATWHYFFDNGSLINFKIASWHYSSMIFFVLTDLIFYGSSMIFN